MKKRCSNRHGLTLVEVIVVLLTLLALAALFLPAMRSAQGPARRSQCLNNQRNVALAVLNFASSNRSRLPAQAYYPGRKTADGTGWETYEGRSWVVELTPYLDHNDLYDRWNFGEPWDSLTTSVTQPKSNTSIAEAYFECLTCPEDNSAFQANGGLSYALNCGIGDTNWFTSTGLRLPGKVESGQHFRVEPFDWNGNGILPPEDAEDVAITRDLTLFWPQFGMPTDVETQTVRSELHSLGEIYDGSGNTIMLGENINAGARSGRAQPSWADPQVCSNGLILPVNRTRVSTTSFSVDGSLASFVIVKPINPAINAALDSSEGQSPFPKSAHPGISIFAFCDGSVRAISEDIDRQVYSRLSTPCGTMVRDLLEFVPEEPLSAESF